MNKVEAKRIAHLCAYGAIRNFIDAGGWIRWSEKDSAKVCAELEKLAKYHDERCFDAKIPAEGGDESRQQPHTQRGACAWCHKVGGHEAGCNKNSPAAESRGNS